MWFNQIGGIQMPYKTIQDLPSSVSHVLPEHAKHIYMKAFNSAWEEYKNKKDRKQGGSHEETAHKVAWAAVKKKYHKVGDKWEAD